MPRRSLLFLAQRLPFPPIKGDKIRSCHLLRHLSGSWNVLLGCFVDHPDDWSHVAAVKELCADACCVPLDRRRAAARGVGALMDGSAVSERWFADRRLARWTAAAVARHRPEAALVCSSAMAQYLPGAAAERPPRVVLDLVDCDSDKWAQYAARSHGPASWLYRRESRRLLALEREVAASADACTFCSESEAAIFRRFAPERAGAVHVIRNGIDTVAFAPGAARGNPFEPSERPVVFTGAMDYRPNVEAVEWFAGEVLPRLARELDGVRFHVVGGRPARRVRRLGRRAGVVVTGAVPDVRPYLEHAAAVVAPMRLAKGIQNKVLEAMAMGKVVVTTPGGRDGIDAEPGRHLLVAAAAPEFAAATLTALTDPGAAAIGRAARELMVERWQWDAPLESFDRLL
jgi:sugar transferase (PEP-CTERM/EpsH1 system associated)